MVVGDCPHLARSQGQDTNTLRFETLTQILQRNITTGDLKVDDVGFYPGRVEHDSPYVGQTDGKPVSIAAHKNQRTTVEIIIARTLSDLESIFGRTQSDRTKR